VRPDESLQRRRMRNTAQMNCAPQRNGALKVLARPAFRGGDTKPYNALLYSALQELGVDVQEFRGRGFLRERSDVLHIHWPESLIEVKNPLSAWVTAQEYRFLFRIARRRGVKILWTIHDLRPHDCVYPDIELPFWQDFVRITDGIIALTQTGLQLARERYACLRNVPAFVIPHGHLREAYPRTLTRDEARRILGIPGSSSVMTFFGQLRPYKNVPRLIRAFRSIDKTDARLFICGRLSKRVNLRNEIVSATGTDPRIILNLRYIPVSEIELYVTAADLIVLPYADILNSGSAILGLSFDRPILVPGIGAMPELRRCVGEEWVRTYHGEIDPRKLKEALAWAISCPRESKAPLEEFGWTAIGEQTLAAYQAIVHAHERGTHFSQ
jgi:beta-1,4-mannosyltransferase